MEVLEMLKSVDFTSNKWVLIIPGVMMFLDVATGLVKAWAQRNVISSKMRIGLAKKFFEVAIIVAVEFLVHGTNIPYAFLTCTSSFVIAMEFISIVENAGECGLKLPAFIIDKLHIFKEVDKND